MPEVVNGQRDFIPNHISYILYILLQNIITIFRYLDPCKRMGNILHVIHPVP